MDHETRFLLASEVTKHRDIEDARKVLARRRRFRRPKSRLPNH